MDNHHFAKLPTRKPDGKPRVKLDHYYELVEGLRARRFASDADFVKHWEQKRLAEGCSRKDVLGTIKEVKREVPQ